MAVFLDGLHLKNYRGIGPEGIKIGPFADFNFFIGANNAGKSTVLSFLHRHLPCSGKTSVPLDPLESYAGIQGSPEVWVGLANQKFLTAVLNGALGANDQIQRGINAIVHVLSDDRMIWLKGSLPVKPRSHEAQFLWPSDPKALLQRVPGQTWRTVWTPFLSTHVRRRPRAALGPPNSSGIPKFTKFVVSKSIAHSRDPTDWAIVRGF